MTETADYDALDVEGYRTGTDVSATEGSRRSLDRTSRACGGVNVLNAHDLVSSSARMIPSREWPGGGSSR